MLHFWASSCGPCRIENKEVVQFAISNKDIVIINVSVDANKEKWVTAIQRDGLGAMVNTCDLKGTNSEMAEAFAIHGIPAYYLIDETGIILARGSLDDMRKHLER